MNHLSQQKHILASTHSQHAREQGILFMETIDRVQVSIDFSLDVQRHTFFIPSTNEQLLSHPILPLLSEGLKGFKIGPIKQGIYSPIYITSIYPK